MSTIHWSYYIDGVEYDPFADFSGTAATVLTWLFQANDCSVSTNVEAYLNNFKVGTTGFGSSNLFSDDFGGSGFSLWDTYYPGTGSVLTESGGMANMVFSTDSPGSPRIGVNVDAHWSILYATWDVKSFNPDGTVLGSPGPTNGCPPAVLGTNDPFHNFILSITKNRISFYDGVSSERRTTTLDDGEWHTLGMKRTVSDFPVPDIPPIRGKFAFFREGQWHIVQDYTSVTP